MAMQQQQPGLAMTPQESTQAALDEFIQMVQQYVSQGIPQEQAIMQALSQISAKYGEAVAQELATQMGVAQAGQPQAAAPAGGTGTPQGGMPPQPMYQGM